MFGDQVTFSQAVIVCVFSLVVVFAVLLVISYVIDLTAWLINRFSKGGKTKAAPAAAPAAQPVRDDSAEAVLVAAAVAAYLGKSTDEFVVRSIRRAGAESPWCQSGKAGSAQ